MREIVVNSFEELNDLVFKDCYDERIKRFRNNYVYRGVPNKEYTLTTKLSRICAHDLSLEDSVIRSFLKYGRADLNSIESFWQTLATGQHFGLPTRLLDWSYSPLVAAHFATENIYEYDKDGAIYCVNIEDSYSFLPKELKEEIDETRSVSFTISMLSKHAKGLRELESLSKDPFFLFYEPASTNDRMINQYALFSICSRADVSIDELLEKKKDNSLYKIIIPKKVKLEIRDKLDYINISERVIYPGLDGVCSWITRRYSDLHKYGGEK